nr:MAG TPA: hypothetical protein [Caudoviricetes sp.]
MVALVVNSKGYDTKEIKSGSNSYLRLQECKKIEQDKWHCNVSVVTKME